MWLKRWVGVSIIVTFLVLNSLVVLGLFVPDRQTKRAVASTDDVAVAAAILPTVSLTMSAGSITAGSSAGLSWTTTGDPTACSATGNWTGSKTAFGSESTGRISAPGTYTYNLECTNGAGSAKASATLAVGTAAVPAKAAAAVTSTSAAGTAKVYCGGRLPCYSASDVARHSSAGNCWGYNLDRVIDISGFDAGFHEIKSGISSITISAICGKNLGPALAGQTSAGGQTRNHNATSKSNADKNMIPYFVGYFDSTKP